MFTQMYYDMFSYKRSSEDLLALVDDIVQRKKPATVTSAWSSIRTCHTMAQSKAGDSVNDVAQTSSNSVYFVLERNGTKVKFNM